MIALDAVPNTFLLIALGAIPNTGLGTRDAAHVTD